MRIRVTGHQKFRSAIGKNDLMEFEMREGTLRDALEFLSRQYGEELEKMIFDTRSKQVKRSNLILLNGQSYLNLRKRLYSELKDGDEITLLPVLTGG